MIALSVLLLMLLSVFAVGAGVVTTAEPTNGSTVYIAGNPDMFPIEYYDDKTDEYRGILPEMYRSISEKSGYDFSYVSAGEKNEQSRLAVNEQVEIVSAHEKGSVEGAADEVDLTVVDKDGEEVTVSIGFTKIASDELRAAIAKGVEGFTASDILSYSAASAERSANVDFPVYLVVIAAAAVLVMILLIILLIVGRKKNKQEKENHLIDPLTGIGNEEHFERWYNSFISPDSSVLYYIAYIGIDVNRILQYSDVGTAEEIQVFAAAELSSAARETDFCARLSDGVFALAYQAPTDELAREKIDELMEKLNGFTSDVMVKYHIRFYAGVFHLDSPNIPCEKALFTARHGYFHSVENELDYTFTDLRLLNRANYVRSLQKKLWKAINEKEFKLYLQYIFDSKGRKVCGAESLSRWESPEDGTIYPKDYIKLLEDAEMIDQLDLYILECCCEHLSRWHETEKKNVWISCNMTRITLSDPAFMERFKAITGKYTFDPAQLVLEITEDAFSGSNKQVINNIRACKEMGYRIALDDFGSGYSSIRDLTDYPIDIIKIDRQLIVKTKKERGATLLDGLVKLSHFLGIEALCEGVETNEQMEKAMEAECDYVQGFLLSRTNPADEASVDRGLSFVSEKDVNDRAERLKAMPFAHGRKPSAPAVIPAPVTEPTPAKAAISPDKEIMAGGAVFSYYGELDKDGNRSGYGRTVTDLGKTAYEGMYSGDKRNGKGTYYYKDGMLCYSGDWDENLRHGVGIGVSAKDGSMHVGQWAHNKPVGTGVRMTADGKISFIRQELPDGGSVMLRTTEDGNLDVVKCDQDGNKLSQSTLYLQ